MRRNTKFRILEFLVAGVLVEILVSSIVFRINAGRMLELRELLIAVMVVIPFSILTELVIDNPRFWHRLFRLKGHKFDHMMSDIQGKK